MDADSHDLAAIRPQLIPLVAVAAGAVLDLNFAGDAHSANSDHDPFYRQGVPFMFLFTGTHEDYHQPGDEPHKIEYDRMAQITRLIFGTAWQVANQDAPPALSGTGFN